MQEGGQSGPPRAARSSRLPSTCCARRSRCPGRRAEKAAPKAAEKAPAAKAGKAGKKKVPEDVEEVEKITAMRVDAKGGLEYQARHGV